MPISEASGTPASPAATRSAFVAVDVRSAGDAPADTIGERLRAELPELDGVVAQVGWVRDVPGLLDPAAPPAPAGPRAVSLLVGGIGGTESSLGVLLREGARREASVLALVAGEPRGDQGAWLRALLAPVLEEGYDYVCPAYGRHALDGALNTGVVYPLTRALYGLRLRQPLGGEAALSPAFARRLAADPDWKRDPEAAGSDAWLVAKALAGRVRTCQAWIGLQPRHAAEALDASHVVERVLGLVFREMERHTDRWQRVHGSEPVPSSGEAPAPSGEPPLPPVGRLAGVFQLGQRELAEIWSAVLPPATLLALRRAAALPPERLRLESGLWARIVYDFGVAHMVRTIERRQLLRSMTPLYLGWLASFANATKGLDPAGVEREVEALCQAFEREKRYAMARWRWPDAFER
ncbi:MAG TPA: hypothetical protein VH880_01095 [Anaeromyxobacteraceae bacterium]|jgi:hypothetical protein